MCLDNHVSEPTTIENPAVDVIVLEIGNVEPGRIDVERVGVLHKELAHAQQARFRPRLIAKLGSDLIPDLRQLLVAAKLFARDLSHDFFFCHAQAKVGALAVLEAEQGVAHQRPAAACLPEFTRVQRRQIEFLPDLVHLLAHDADDFVEGALSQEKIGINSRGKLTDVGRPHQELVAGDLGIRWRLAQCRNKKVRPAMHNENPE